MAKQIHVVLAADANYAPGLEVTRKSILGSCSHPGRLQFHVFDETVLDELSGLESFNLYNTSKMPYLRLFLPELLPEVDWAIYSDVDTIWNRDICELADLFDSSVCIQWVKDFESTMMEARPWIARVGMPFEESRYCCSGICILNLKKMRTTNLSACALDLVRRFGTPPYADQDILNVLYNQDCSLLPDCWDVLGGLGDWRVPAVYHLTGVGLHFHDKVSPVYPPQYQLWWNVAHGTKDVHWRSSLLAFLWPFRFFAWLFPVSIRERILRQCFFAKVLASGLLFDSNAEERGKELCAK